MNLCPPANIEAFAKDHQYASVSMEDHFLQQNKITAINPETIQEIEEETRLQAHCPLWFAEKTKRITASKFGKICAATGRKDMQVLAKSIIRPTSLKKSKACMHGIQYEGVAIEHFEKKSNLAVGTG